MTNVGAIAIGVAAIFPASALPADLQGMRPAVRGRWGRAARLRGFPGLGARPFRG
jgi:hypothetical protein